MHDNLKQQILTYVIPGFAFMKELSQLNDDKLVEKYFQKFYLSYAGRMISFARQYVDADTAEDIVHDIFLKVWDQKSTIIVDKESQNYLLSMVKNACYDHLKHQKVSETFLNKAELQLKMDSLAYDEISNNDPNETLQVIYALIDKLPPKSKAIFEKAYLEKQKSKDIAAEMNLSVRTVETHIYNALKLIRKSLKSSDLLPFLFSMVSSILI